MNGLLADLHLKLHSSWAVHEIIWRPSVKDLVVENNTCPRKTRNILVPLSFMFKVVSNVDIILDKLYWLVRNLLSTFIILFCKMIYFLRMKDFNYTPDIYSDVFFLEVICLLSIHSPRIRFILKLKGNNSGGSFKLSFPVLILIITTEKVTPFSLTFLRQKIFE